MKAIQMALLLGLIGLCVGYGIFGQINGRYIAVDRLISAPQGIFDNIAHTAFGIDKIRQNILISGAVGAMIGLLIGSFSSKKKR